MNWRYCVACILGMSITGFTLAQNFVIDWHTVDCGGAAGTTGGNWELSGTIGQPDAGTMTGGNWDVAGGFWPGVVFIPTADFDGDGDVDLDDYAEFPACMSGPGGTSTGAGCEAFDLDRNNALDLLDVAKFQAAFTGPS